MSSRSIQMTEDIYSYLLRNSLRENIHCVQLREETQLLTMAGMQVSPEQGQLMGLLIEIIGATRVIEVGVFTGYSCLCMALALPEDGTIVACDVSEEWTSVGEKYWSLAGVRDKIDLRLAPAAETLREMVTQGESGQYDVAFIDADKSNYDVYYELCLQLLRTGGVLLIDNVLWGGAVADKSIVDGDTESIRTLNQKIYLDDRVAMSMIPIGDGLTLAVKK